MPQQALLDELADDLAAVRATSPKSKTPPALADELASDLEAVRAQPVQVATLPTSGTPRPPVRQAELVAMTPARITEPRRTAQQTRQEYEDARRRLGGAYRPEEAGPTTGPVPPARYPDIDPRTGVPVTRVPLGQLPVLDAPLTGVPKMVEAGKRLGPVAAQPFGKSLGKPDIEAANLFMEGLFQTTEPLIAASAIADPIGTAFALAKAYLASTVGEKGAEVLGGSIETQRFVGNIAAVLSGAVSVRDFVRRNVHDAAAVLKQAKAFDAAQAKPVAPTEPKPVGRGRTLSAQAAGPKLEAENRVPEPAPVQEPQAAPAPEVRAPAVSTARVVDDLRRARAENNVDALMTAVAELTKRGMSPADIAAVQERRALDTVAQRKQFDVRSEILRLANPSWTPAQVRQAVLEEFEDQGRTPPEVAPSAEGVAAELAEDLAAVRQPDAREPAPEPPAVRAAAPVPVAPQPVSAAPPAPVAGPTIRANPDRGSIEITFKEKPTREVIDALKRGGFRWAKTNQLWYRRGGTVEQAQTLLGGAAPTATPPPKATPAAVEPGLPTSGTEQEPESREAIIEQILEAAKKPQKELDAFRAHLAQEPDDRLQAQAKYWLKRDVTIAPSEVSAVPPPRPTRQTGRAAPQQWNPIGVNKDGHTVYEDQNGVRSYLEGQFRFSEAVSLTPTRAGLVARPAERKAGSQWDVVGPVPEKDAEVVSEPDELAQDLAEVRGKSSEAGPFVVRFGDDGRTVAVGSIEEAVRVHNEARDAFEAQQGPGASEFWPVVTVANRQTGEVSRIHYNGRVEPQTGVKSAEEPSHEDRDIDTGELPAGPSRTPRPAGARSQGALAAVSPEGEPGTRAGGATRSDDPEGLLEDRARRDAAASSQPDPLPSDGGGDGPTRVAVSPSGNFHDPGPRHLDYALTSERIHAIISRGHVQRAKDNLAAIQLVQTLKEESRYPSVAEQDVLAKYVGWGASDMKPFTGDEPKPTWSRNERAVWDEIQKLPEESRAALKRSILNAHYTYDLYQPIWEALVHAGFSGGRVLEPAIGTGHAIGFMPASVRAASILNASELEPFTAAIAGYLYPSVTVQAVGYQQILIPRNTQDLIISNVPFGDYGIIDPTMPDFTTESIHNYFFAHAVDHARPGGLIVFVTSRYTLDAPDATRFRRYVADRADFLGAIRLPNTAFDKSAKTEVVTDLVVLRKRAETDPASENDSLFVTTAEHPTLKGSYDYRSGKVSKIYRSTWYTDHPDYILGEESLEGTQHRKGEYTVTGRDETLTTAIGAALTRLLPPGTYIPPAKIAAIRQAKKEEGAYKPGELRVGENRQTIDRVQADGVVVDATPRGKDGQPAIMSVERIVGMIGIRDALRKLSDAELSDQSDAQLDALRNAFRKAYDAFVAKYGELNRSTNKRLFAADPEAATLLGLEKLEAKARHVTGKDGSQILRIDYQVTGRADIFTKRTLKAPTRIESVDTPKDALLASLGVYGAIDWPYISQVAGRSVEAMQEDLVEQGLVFEQPDGSFVLAEEYLSGDVVTKIEDAKAAGARLARNVSALQAVQPEPKTRDDIANNIVGVNLGSHWIEAKDIDRFAAQSLGLERRGVAATLGGTSTVIHWEVQSTSNAQDRAKQHPLAVHYANGTRTYDWLDLLTDTLNLRMPDLGHWEGPKDARTFVKEPEATLAARANQETLRREWLDFVFGDEGMQDRILKVFNARYNRTVERQFDGSHLTYPGKTDLVTFYPHQNRAVWRILATGNTLLAHEVGAGKTFEMIAAAMEMRRTGRAQKPMIVVPTNLLGAWRRDVMTLYPKARLLAFDETDLKKDKRQASMARIAYGEWDIVLVPHSSFGLLKVSDQRIIDMMQRWIDEIQEAMDEERTGDETLAELERQKLRIEKRIAKKAEALNASDDNALVWEQLGVDALFIDEAQAFKNLFFFSKLENLRGLSKSESDRALDLFVKIQEINEQSHYRNLVLATATPVMNSIAEAYTMQRYLQPQTLQRYGVDTFDNWYAMFAKAAPTTEQQPDGTYKEVMRLKDFSNLQLLSKMVREVMDYMGWEDMPYLKLPKIRGGKITIVQNEPHPMYPILQEWFAQRMQNIRDTPPHIDRRTGDYVAPARPDPLTGEPTGRLDNILTIMNDAKKAAVDVRLILGDRAKDYPGSRVQQAAAAMYAEYKREHKNKGVQLVFLDLGTPKDPPALEFLRDVKIEDARDDVVEDETAANDAEAAGRDAEDDGGGLFNLYEALKRALVTRGVPSREIAFIHSAKNSAQRIALFDAANEGKVRFVFASTDKGGVGMNIQKRMTMIHEIDAPRAMRPGDLRQRMGRGVRQGNQYESIGLSRYVTKGTTDEWLWGLLNTKDYQIRQFLKGNAATMSEEDPSTMSLQEAQIRASGDPRGIELTELKGKLARLQAQAMAAERAYAQAKTDVQRGSLQRKHLETDLADLRAWLKDGYRTQRGDHFSITIEGAAYTKRDEATDAILAAAKRIVTQHPEGTITIGNLGGLDLMARVHQFAYSVELNEAEKAAEAERFAKSKAKDKRLQTHTRVMVPRVSLHLDGTTQKLDTYGAGDLVPADKRNPATLGVGQNPIAAVVNAYEGIPAHEHLLETKLREETEKVTAAQRLVDHPPKVIQEAARAVERIAQIEAEFRAEGAANEAARKAQPKPAQTPDETEPETEEDDDVSAMAHGGTPLPKRPPPAKQTVALPVEAIIRKLSDVFGRLPVGVKHFQQQAVGIYKKGQQAVRSRTANDLDTVAHEFGHHLDLALMQGSAVHKRGAIAKELRTLGAPTSKPSYDAKQRRQEGAAEFFRLWLLTPEVLVTDAPLYLNEFERFMAAHPDLHQGLLEIRDDVQTYLSIAGVDQAKLSIDFEGGSMSILARAARLFDAARDAHGRRSALTYLSEQWADDLAWINRVEREVTAGQPISIVESAYALARLARGAPGKAEGFLRYGVRDAQGQVIGPSMDSAIEPIAKDLVPFNVYLKALHARDMEAKGIESGMSAGQIAESLQLRSPAFDAAADRLQAFQRAMRRYMVERGVWSREQVRAMEQKWPHYVPMQRVMEAVATGLSGGRRIANRTNPAKRLKGSGRRTKPALENIIQNTHDMVATAESNRAMLALVNLLVDTPGTAKWLEEIPTPKVPTTFNLSLVEQQIRDVLEAAGIDLPHNFQFDDLATVFTPRQFARGNERFVTVIDKGRLRWFEVHEPGLYDAIAAVGPENTEQVLKLFWRGTQTLRKFATTTLGFIVSRNPPRDIVTAMIYSRAGFRPTDFLRGLFAALGHTEDYQLFVHSGAGRSAQVARDRDLVRRRLKDLGQGKVRQLLNHTLLGPIDGLQALSQLLEEATRVGEFTRTLKRMGRDDAGIMQAGLNAADVTQDFSVMGRQVRAWNRFVAFFGARVGGYVRLGQAVKEGGGGRIPPGTRPPGASPGGATGGFGGANVESSGPAGFFFKAAGIISLLSTLLWILHKDDEEYYQLPAWERREYWHLPISGGYLRVSKPFELGMAFGTTMEDALDWLYRKDRSITQSLPSDSAAKELMLMLVPTLLLPMLQVYVNYDIFRDRTIVNPFETDLEPPLQYNRWTSETAKKLGRYLNLSPAKIESLIYGYTAGVGRGVLQATDVLQRGAVPRPAEGVERLPLVGSVYRRQATSDAQALTDFYEARDALTGLTQSLKRYVSTGDTAAADALEEAHRDLLDRAAVIRSTETHLKRARASITAIFDSPTMTPEQKRQELDAAYDYMKRVARHALQSSSEAAGPETAAGVP